MLPIVVVRLLLGVLLITKTLLVVQFPANKLVTVLVPSLILRLQIMLIRGTRPRSPYLSPKVLSPVESMTVILAKLRTPASFLRMLGNGPLLLVNLALTFLPIPPSYIKVPLRLVEDVPVTLILRDVPDNDGVPPV